MRSFLLQFAVFSMLFVIANSEDAVITWEVFKTLNYCGEDARSEASRRAVSTVNKACRKLDKEKKTVGDCIPARVELQNWNWLTKYGTKTMGMCTENGQPSFCVAKHPDGQSLLRWEVAWNDGSYECTGMVKYGKQKKSSDGNGASEGSSSAVDVGSSNSVAFPYDYSGYPYLR